MSRKSRVLLIGLDAAEPELIERWTQDGALPNLAGLLARGSYGRLSPPDGVLLGPPWPSFYSSRPVSEHGLYEYLVWDPSRMHEVRANQACALTPFWRDFDSDGPRSIVVDVPLVPSPTRFNGLEVTCWGTHERLVPHATQPPGLAKRLAREIGYRPMHSEIHHQVSYGRLLRERDMLMEVTGGVADLATHLMRTEPWDLGLVCFSACHRAGHKLWSETGANGRGSAVDSSALSDALRAVYSAVDRAVGRVVQEAPPDTDVLVFSLHGMGSNTSRAKVLPDLLDRILSDGDGEGRGSPLARLRQATPLGVRDWVKARLPVGVQDRLSTYWRTRRDWSETKAISLTADLHGFVRINLAGRERLGSVPPESYDEVCEMITRGLLSFRDADSGEAVVSKVVRRTDLYPEGAYVDLLPDLVVVWNETPTAEHRALVSDQHGRVDWPTPGRNFDGRSGNHRLQGWLAAAGPSIDRSAEIRGATILDIAPTALTLLGLDVPPGMRGTALLQPANRELG